MKGIDKFTGKPIDKFSDLFPTYNGGKCDYCGHDTIDRCSVCGAPQCCPRCCKDSLEELKGIEYE